MPPANNTIHILGGLPDFSKHSITDSFTNFMLKTFCANKAFISCDGVTPNYGITAYYPPDAEAGRLMIKHVAVHSGLWQP